MLSLLGLRAELVKVVRVTGDVLGGGFNINRWGQTQETVAEASNPSNHKNADTHLIEKAFSITAHKQDRDAHTSTETHTKCGLNVFLTCYH